MVNFVLAADDKAGTATTMTTLEMRYNRYSY